MSIAEHLTETDERIPASALYAEHYLDDDVDTISDAEWNEAMDFFDRAQDCEDDEDYGRDDEDYGYYLYVIEDAGMEYGFFND